MSYFVCSSAKALLGKCPSVQWQPDGLTIHTNKWLLGAGFLQAPPISLSHWLPDFWQRLSREQHEQEQHGNLTRRCLWNKHSSGEEGMWANQLSKHQIRGWRAVSAAGLQGNIWHTRSAVASACGKAVRWYSFELCRKFWTKTKRAVAHAKNNKQTACGTCFTPSTTRYEQ